MGFGANSAIGMMALTGPCNLLSASTFVMVNELTTVAAEWALARFVGADGLTIGSSATNATGLSIAHLQASFNLVRSYMASGGKPSNTGVPADFLPTAADCTGSPPLENCDALERINTLANIIASCINSTGPASAQCSTLFSNTGNSTTTLQSAHVIASQPMANVAAIFAIPPTAGLALFAPALTAAPDGWELALSFAPQFDFSQLTGLAIDSSGYVWISDSGGGVVTKLSPIGRLVGNFLPVPGVAYFSPSALAIDSADNVWVTNVGIPHRPLLKLDSSGALIGEFNPSGANFSDPYAIAITREGDVWVTNPGNSTVTALDSAGNLISNTSGFALSPLTYPRGLAVSAPNYVWVTDYDRMVRLDYATGTPPLPGPGRRFFAPFEANFTDTHAVAIGPGRAVWVTNPGSNQVSVLAAPPDFGTNRSFVNSGFPGGIPGANFDSPSALALDPSANLWVTNESGHTVTELNVNGLNVSLVGNFHPPGANFSLPNGIAIDASGNVWVTNRYPGRVSVLIGATAPVKTPLVACPAGPCSP